MEQDKLTTDVIFRVDNTKDFKGTIFALFPHEVWDKQGNVTSYQHVGQHSGADYNHCIKNSKLATPTQALKLYTELETIGYKLNVVKKQDYKLFLKAYKTR